MKLPIYFLIFFCSAFTEFTYSQDIYAWYRDDDAALPRYEMYKYDFFKGNQQLLFTIAQKRFADLNKAVLFPAIHSFEYSRDGRYIYFIQLEGALFRYEIATDSLVFLLDLTPEITPYLFVHGYTQISNINFISDSIIYTSGFTFSEYNINTNTYKRIRQPIDRFAAASQREQDILTGRLVRHKGEYIYLSQNTDKLMKLDMSNPDNNSTLLDLGQLFSINFNSQNLISMQYECDSTALYFFGTPNVLDQTFKNGWYKLDPTTGALQYSHDDVLQVVAGFKVLHKRYNNPTWEDCQRYIDLDKDDNTAMNKDFAIDSLCIYTQIPLSDLDIHINNEYPIDSIDIFIYNPAFSHYLIFPSGNYNLKTSPNFWQRIVNNGITSLDDYETAIRSAYLEIRDDPNPDNEIKIGFQAWYKGIAGDTAIATIKISGPLPFAGTDSLYLYCKGDKNIELKELIGVGASQDGFFYNSNYNIVSQIPPIATNDSTTLYYIVSNGVCRDTASSTVKINPRPIIDALRDTLLCQDQTLNITIPSNGNKIEWSDGSNNFIRELSSSGVYGYTITNQFDCESSDTFAIQKLPPTSINNTSIQICRDSIYKYNGEDIRQAGIYRDTILNIRACDSIISTLDLRYFDYVPLLITGDTSICDGESTILKIESNHSEVIWNNEVQQNTFFVDKEEKIKVSAKDQNGCISTKEISILEHPSPTILTTDMLDTIFSEDMLLVVEYFGTNNMSYIWTPSSNLSCSDCPFPSLLQANDEAYTVSIINEFGCESRATIRVTFADEDLYLPNIISSHPAIPENGTFYAKSKGSIQYNMSIYDRWGNLIFNAKNLQTNDATKGWQPNHILSQGVYVYIINYNENGHVKYIKGDITILENR